MVDRGYGRNWFADIKWDFGMFFQYPGWGRDRVNLSGAGIFSLDFEVWKKIHKSWYTVCSSWYHWSSQVKCFQHSFFPKICVRIRHLVISSELGDCFDRLIVSRITYIQSACNPSTLIARNYGYRPLWLIYPFCTSCPSLKVYYQAYN